MLPSGLVKQPGSWNTRAFMVAGASPLGHDWDHVRHARAAFLLCHRLGAVLADRPWNTKTNS